MTVKDLIEELQGLDPNAEVRVLRDCDEDVENFWVSSIDTENESTKYSTVILNACE